jgi:hypothetical protein
MLLTANFLEMLCFEQFLMRTFEFYLAWMRHSDWREIMDLGNKYLSLYTGIVNYLDKLYYWTIQTSDAR